MEIKSVKKLIYVGELDRTPDAYDHRGIRQGLEWMGIDYLIVDPVLLPPDEVVRRCNDFRADLIVHGNTDSLTNNTIPRIRGKQIFFMGDVRIAADYPWDQWLANSRGISGIAISNRDQIPLWREKFNAPAFFWPHGCLVLEELPYEEKFKYDVVFIGTMNNSEPFNKRYELIKEIEKRIDVPITYINAGDVAGRNQIWRDMAAIYHSSKIVLDISHFWNLSGYASGRYWYSAGLGACTVTKRFPGCEDFYKDKKHKLYFDTADEAAALIKQYLGNSLARMEIKKAAHRHNQQFHNYKIRFDQLIKNA